MMAIPAANQDHGAHIMALVAMAAQGEVLEPPVIQTRSPERKLPPTIYPNEDILNACLMQAGQI